VTKKKVKSGKDRPSASLKALPGPDGRPANFEIASSKTREAIFVGSTWRLEQRVLNSTMERLRYLSGSGTLAETWVGRVLLPGGTFKYWRAFRL